MKLQKDTLTRHGIDKTSRRLLETIVRCYPASIEIGELSKMIGVSGKTLKSSITRLRKLNIPINKLKEYASILGSDCSFFIENNPKFAEGTGAQLYDVDLDLKNYKFIIVNPGIHVNTAWAYSMIKPKQPLQSLKTLINL